jgi:hypothetical protein
MHILFAISALGFFALVLAASAIVRHVRSTRRPTHPQNDFAQHLFAAVEDQDSRRPRALEEQSVQDVIAKNSWNRTPEAITELMHNLRLQANAPNQSTSSKRF